MSGCLVRVTLFLLGLPLVLLLVPAVNGLPSAAEVTTDLEGVQSCPWIVIRPAEPGEVVYGVDVDPDGCLRHQIRKIIGWGGP